MALLYYQEASMFQQIRQLVERGNTYGNCSSISGLNFSADRPGSDNPLNHLMGMPLFAVAIPYYMILLLWICEFWELCCGCLNGVETAITPIPWKMWSYHLVHLCCGRHCYPPTESHCLGTLEGRLQSLTRWWNSAWTL